MSDIAVTVTNPGSAAVTIGAGGSVSATVSSGGSVEVNLPGGEAAWANITGKPTTFTPAAHTHVAADITDRATALVTSVNGQTGAVTISGGGSSNLTLSDATPSALGTAAAGTSNQAARGDHVHELPSLSTLGAAAANHAHNYVTSLNNLTGSLTLAAGANVTITPSGSTLTIASTASGGIGENDAVDGGFYVGEFPSIVYTLHPQNQTINLPIGVTFGSATAYSSNISEYAESFANLNGVLFARSSTNPYVGVGQSVDDGATWTRRTDMSGGTTSFYGPISLASNGTRVVLSAGTASGSSGSGWFYSDDGMATVSHVSNGALIGPPQNPAAVRPNARSVIYFGGKFFAVRPTATNLDTNQVTTGAILASLDGVEWSQSLAFDDGIVIGAFVVNGKLLVIGRGIVASTLDGVSWSTATAGTLPAARVIAQIVTNGKRLVGISNVGDLWTSADGTGGWQAAAFPIAQVPNRLLYAQGLFWAWASEASDNQQNVIRSNQIAHSADGVAWTATTHNQNMILLGAVSASNSSVLWLGFGSVGSESLRGNVATTSGSANLTVSATIAGGSAIGYQWQRSIDAGASWNNLANATSSALNLTGLTQADNGTRYRAVASATGATPTPSQSATLTVTG